MFLPIVIALDNSDSGSEFSEDATSGIRATGFVGIDGVDHFQKSNLGFHLEVKFRPLSCGSISLISFC